ncbi:hypothetical protein QAD02_001387 [Eretmocerus hayati]|uniref:Uncharacterized protein n=1 Tax=Eretmocerus hayati TaxID=131215 RepID=A0ACC2NH47_9HYME|nr:hypothetical protein QAD02_001387 [Eretmocerus hayati]
MFLWIASFAIIFSFVNGQNDCFYIELLNGHSMPRIGLGTYKVQPNQVASTIESAVKIGYRHFDLAPSYGNEEAIGKVFSELFAKGYDRSNFFITTKLGSPALRASDVPKAVERSLRILGIGYIDMYLIHHAFGTKRTKDFDWFKYKNGSLALDYTTDHIAVWKALEHQVWAGKIRSLGLSNFNQSQILRIWNNSWIKPSNIEMEVNVYIQQQRFVDWCQDLGMVVTAYSPLGSDDTTRFRRKRQAITLPSQLEHPLVIHIAEKHGRTPAQILLRYSYQRNIVVIPKSTNPERIAENLNIFDFELDQNDMGRLRNLDQHGKYKKFDYSTLKGVRSHPEFPYVTSLAD